MKVARSLLTSLLWLPYCSAFIAPHAKKVNAFGVGQGRFADSCRWSAVADAPTDNAVDEGKTEQKIRNIAVIGR